MRRQSAVFVALREPWSGCDAYGTRWGTRTGSEGTPAPQVSHSHDRHALRLAKVVALVRVLRGVRHHDTRVPLTDD